MADFCDSGLSNAKNVAPSNRRNPALEAVGSESAKKPGFLPLSRFPTRFQPGCYHPPHTPPRLEGRGRARGRRPATNHERNVNR